jgi:ADP-heptose:LPS heptosyltransferase
LLLNQQWSLGWLYYEARPSQDLKPPAIIDAMPRWTPGDAPPRTVLVLVSEQGIGDFVFFARFAEMAKARCASMVFYVEPPLAELAHDLNLEAYVCTSADELAAIQARLDDYMFRKIPMGSLALAFHDPTLAPVGQSAYLSPAVYLRRKFSETQAKLPINMAGLPTVGLAWRGSPKHKRDRIRSILLAELLEYLPQPAQYVALYPEVSATESELLNKHGVQSYGCEIANIASTLALISTMHLVIAVDTSLAHLSAAQGKPTWILLPKACDWRWGTDPNRTLWYNHARLFRQTQHSDWSDPLSRIKASLVNELQTISQPTF